MRIEIGLICASLLLTGCIHRRPPAGNSPPSERKTPPKATVIPNLGPVGRVEMVNVEGRFVVLSFPQGHVPKAGEHWRINHNGLTIGRVTITGPRRDIDTVGDITDGEAHVGDEATPE